MPALQDTQYEQFARLLASGSSLIDAYHLIYPEVPRTSAQNKATRLAQRPEVEERLAELAEQNTAEAIWTLSERLAYLRALVLSTPAEASLGSSHCAGVSWTTTGPRFRTYDKVSALTLYAKLAGDLDIPNEPPADLFSEYFTAILDHKLDEQSAARRTGLALENLRHERFAQLVGSGERPAYAYAKLYGISCTDARIEAYRLTRRPEVADRIAFIRRAGAALDGWPRDQRLRFLRDLVECPLVDLDENSPFCQSFRRDNNGPHIKIPNKLRAIQLYTRLIGVRDAARPQTIEQIVQGMHDRGNHTLAHSVENELIHYVAGHGIYFVKALKIIGCEFGGRVAG